MTFYIITYYCHKFQFTMNTQSEELSNCGFNYVARHVQLKDLDKIA